MFFKKVVQCQNIQGVPHSMSENCTKFHCTDKIISYHSFTGYFRYNLRHYGDYEYPQETGFPQVLQKAGTGPSRLHIQGSKIAKGLPSVNLQYSKIEKPKKYGPSGAPGPASPSPWLLKWGDTSEIVNIFVAVDGRTLWRKKFSKSHNAEKLKGGTLWDFSTSILSQNSKKN